MTAAGRPWLAADREGGVIITIGGMVVKRIPPEDFDALAERLGHPCSRHHTRARLPCHLDMEHGCEL